MSTEREDLDNLLKSPGWQRLEQWAQHEWRTQVAHHTEVAANEADDVAALNKLRQVIAAKKAVELVLNWPQKRLQDVVSQAAHAERVPVLNRRGGL